MLHRIWLILSFLSLSFYDYLRAKINYVIFSQHESKADIATSDDIYHILYLMQSVSGSGSELQVDLLISLKRCVDK